MLCTNGTVSVCDAVLDSESEITLLHLQLGLTDHIELHRLDAEGLRVLPRRVIGRGIALDDSDAIVSRRADVTEEIVYVALHQRHLGRQLGEMRRP